MDIMNIVYTLAFAGILGILLGAVCALLPEDVPSRDIPVTHEPQTANDSVAFVRCSGGDRSVKRFNYKGLRDCAAALTVSGGPNECRYGCIGMGSCVSVCPTGAMQLSAAGFARAERELCIGCMRCADVCPQGLITAVPRDAQVHVGCVNREIRAALRVVCEAGCIGCGECVNACKYGAVQVVEDLAVIDYEKCTSCGECAAVCPREIIISPFLSEEKITE